MRRRRGFGAGCARGICRRHDADHGARSAGAIGRAARVEPARRAVAGRGALASRRSVGGRCVDSRDAALDSRMIGRLTGVLVEKNPPQLVLDVQGLGYEVDVPMSTFYNLPAIGETVALFTHLVVREDAHLLYGFGSEAERRAF